MLKLVAKSKNSFSRKLTSHKLPYGLIASNNILHLDHEHQVAIGLVEGDDVICIDLKDGSINLWLVENGNGEHITLAPDFASFWRLITEGSKIPYEFTTGCRE